MRTGSGPDLDSLGPMHKNGQRPGHVALCAFGTFFRGGLISRMDLMFERVEKLKREYTDKFVVVDDTRPELARFHGITGQVKTVNMSGRALVQFDAWANIGWYDIDPDYLTVIPEPLPKPEPKAEAPAKKAAPAKAAPAAEGEAKPAAAKPAAAKALADPQRPTFWPRRGPANRLPRRQRRPPAPKLRWPNRLPPNPLRPSLPRRGRRARPTFWPLPGGRKRPPNRHWKKKPSRPKPNRPRSMKSPLPRRRLLVSRRADQSRRRRPTRSLGVANTTRSDRPKRHRGPIAKRNRWRAPRT